MSYPKNASHTRQGDTKIWFGKQCLFCYWYPTFNLFCSYAYYSTYWRACFNIVLCWNLKHFWKDFEAFVLHRRYGFRNDQSSFHSSLSLLRLQIEYGLLHGILAIYWLSCSHNLQLQQVYHVTNHILAESFFEKLNNCESVIFCANFNPYFCWPFTLLRKPECIWCFYVLLVKD